MRSSSSASVVSTLSSPLTLLGLLIMRLTMQRRLGRSSETGPRKWVNNCSRYLMRSASLSRAFADALTPASCIQFLPVRWHRAHGSLPSHFSFKRRQLAHALVARTRDSSGTARFRRRFVACSMPNVVLWRMFGDKDRVGQSGKGRGQ